MRTALYARVSTKDQQTLPMQMKAMREYAKNRQWKVVKEIKEIGSGADNNRPEREKLIKLAKQRKLDAVVVWKFDRWGRSMTDFVLTVNDLKDSGVVFVSITEALDLSTPIGEMTAGIFALLAQYERKLLSERVKAGMEYAKSKGKHVGRPPTNKKKTEEVKRLYKEGLSKYAITKELKMGWETVNKILEIS
jgi:DNA invertase Pin-like site-specific DNA recombinase